MYKYLLLFVVALAAATMLTLMAATLESQRDNALAAPVQTAIANVFNPTPWV
jgi:hypothetical protein